MVRTPAARVVSSRSFAGHERRFVLAVLGLYLFFGAGYSVLVPIWEAPDEPDHYRVVLHLARDQGPVHPGVSREASQPLLYYWLASWPLRAIDRIDQRMVDFYNPSPEVAHQVEPWSGRPMIAWTEENERFMLGPRLLRWLGLLMGGVAACFVFLGAVRMVPDCAPLARTTLVLVALNPQFLHVSTSVSNDVIAILAGAWLFWLLGGVVSEQPSAARSALALTCATVLPFVTKLTVLPIAVVVLAATAWRSRHLWRSSWTLPLLGVGVAAVGAAFCGLLPEASRERLWEEIVWRATFVQPQYRDFMPTRPIWFAWSYWGVLGWMTVPLDRSAALLACGFAGVGGFAALGCLIPHPSPRVRWALVLGVLMGGLVLLPAHVRAYWLACAAIPVMVWRGRDAPRGGGAGWTSERAAWGLLWLATALTLLVAFKNSLANGQAQGRFLFPSIGALSMIMAGGWLALLGRHGRLLPYGAALLTIGLNLVLWFDGILAAYYARPPA